MQTTEQLELDLFDRTRWPRKPYCSDDLSTGVKIRSLRSALKRAYIQANPPHLRVWSIFDVDREGAALAWEQAMLPPPSWISVNRQNAHAHLVWGLSAPVLVDSLAAREAPLRYLCAIEAMFREKLQADSGFAGLITKNPAHPLWKTLFGPRLGYELSELAEYLPGIEKFRPKPKGRKVEEVGLGRNVALFDLLRKWAYRHVLEYKRMGGLDGWNAWLSRCNAQALCFNQFQYPLDGREVWWIAKSVAKWTWRNFSEAGRSEWAAKRGKAGGLAKGRGYEEKRASARLMRAAGMTQAEIARELGVSQQTVSLWLKQ